MRYKVDLEKRAQKDFEKKVKRSEYCRKVEELLELLERDPFETPPAYEELADNLKGKYSRRISVKHRLVYEVVEGEFTENGEVYKGKVKVLRMWTHYEGFPVIF